MLKVIFVPLERCKSGLIGTPGKRVNWKRFRGFESLPFRSTNSMAESSRSNFLSDPRNALEDWEIVTSVVAGETQKFELIHKKYRRMLTGVVRKMVRVPEDVDDLVQETFLKAFKALHTFSGQYEFSKWLFRICSNNTIDYLRRQRFKPLSLDKPVSGNDGSDYTVEVADMSYVLADNAIILEERRLALKKAIEDLPEKYRIIIKLRHEEELDYYQIADRLQLPLGTVKVHLFRARKLMYQRLKGDQALFEEEFSRASTDVE